MFFWIREIAGWALILVSLYLIATGLSYVSNLKEPRIVESAILMIAAVGVMRCGVLLIRISSAMRVADSMKKIEKT
jgi:hypothetical protein